MDYKHREVIKKYSRILQQSINLQDMKDSLRESKIFTAHMLRDIYEGEASLFEELPTRGPDAFDGFINLLKLNQLSPIAEKLCHVANPDYQISENHGYNLIILNSKFEGLKCSEEFKELERVYNVEASSLDSALQKHVKNLKFCVNKERDELYSVLKKFSEEDHTGVNSCIVIILGLGTREEDSKVIYGSDGKYIFLHKILNLFSDINCPSLKDKPKIFLLPSFDVSYNDAAERVELSTDVNDTFLWFFPPLKIYKCVNKLKSKEIERNTEEDEKQNKVKFFGQILSESLRENNFKFNFETVFKSSYRKYLEQLKNEKIPTDALSDIPESEKLGYCRERIIFT